MNVIVNLDYLGVEEKVSQKTGNPYLLVNYLEESGKAITTMLKCPIPKDIKRYDKVLVMFDLQLGKYISVATIGIDKIES